MSNNKHSGRGIYGKGYYIALILCAAAIGITGILYYRNAQEAQPVIQEPEQQERLQQEQPRDWEQNPDPEWALREALFRERELLPFLR